MALACVVALVVGGWFVFRGTIVRTIVLRDLAALTGGDVTAERVVLRTDGTLVLENPVVRAPGVAGEGGVVFSASRIEAEIDLGGAARGQPRLRSVLLDAPVARLSQSTVDGTLAAGSLRPTAAPSGRLTIPTVVVRAGVVELGEHDNAGGYVALRQVPVAGEVARASDDSGTMIISFAELGPDGQPLAGPGGLQLTGAVADDHVTLSLGVISLASWGPEAMPAPIREPFRNLAMEGQILGTTLRYGFDGSVEAGAEVRGVALNLPVGVQPGEDAEGGVIPVSPEDAEKRLRLRQVNGRIRLTNDGVRASLSGLLEGLPYDVTFETRGSSASAPFTCTITCTDLHVAQKPEILKFAPGVVRRRLEQFSDPTGTIDVSVTMARAEGAPDLSVTGRLRLRNTTAAFERFPYRFSNMRGEVEFDDQRIVIHSIEGEAPGGATLHATGRIESLTDEAGVHVDVVARNIPIDATLRDAMGARGWLLDELFARDVHDQLVRDGLLPADHPPPGGVADVRAEVRREPGPGDVWHDLVTITLREARVLARSFPVPLHAQGVTIVKDDFAASLSGGTIRVHAGGDLTIRAEADMRQLDTVGAALTPIAEVTATGVVLSPVLLAAAPETIRVGETPLPAFLRGLNPRGSLDASVTLAPPTETTPAWNVRLSGAGLAAAPARADQPDQPDHTPSRVRIEVATFTLEADPARVSIDVAGAMAPTEGPATPGTLRVRATLEDGREGYEVEARAPGFDIATHVEDIVGLVSGASGRTLADLRSRYEPAGRADVVARVFSERGSEPGVQVRVSRVEDAAASLDGRRLTASGMRGVVEVLGDGVGPWGVRFEEFEAALRVDGADDGVFSASGACLIDGASVDLPLVIRLAGGRFESPLVRTLLGRAAPPRLAAFFHDSDVRGVFDLDATLTPRPEGAWDAAGVLAPRAMAARFGEREIVFARVEGAIEFSRDQGRVRTLALHAPGWLARADGGWIVGADGGLSLSADAALESEGLSPDLLALAPGVLRDALTDLRVGAAGPVRVAPAQVRLTTDGAGALVALGVDGRAIVQDLALEAGVAVDGASGFLDFAVQRDAPGAPITFDLQGVFDRARAGGLRLTGTRVRVLGMPDGSVVVPHLAASAYGGRLAGEVAIAPPDAGRRRYDMTLRASEVRFASMLRDLGRDAAGLVEESEAESPDESRGVLDAGVWLSGVLGEASSRRGRGTGVVEGGRVVNMPLLVPLVRATNLQLPLNERVDYAGAEFFVQGEYLNFESLTASSRSVEVFGFGTVHLPGMDLDLRFRPKARARIPMLTGLLEGIRDELVTVRAEGTLAQPELKVSTLAGTTRFIGKLFGETPDEQERRLRAIEARGGSGRDLRRPTGDLRTE
jgi:hypothetical protein